MTTRLLKIVPTAVLAVSVSAAALSQDASHARHAGIMITAGTQQAFPFNSRDYTYGYCGIKGIYNMKAGSRGRFVFELQAEPGINKANHRLLNKYFVQPDYGTDYLELRDRYAAEKTIMEYYLNLGVVLRAEISESFSLYVTGSVGPMFGDTETERLARGFAFSDFIAAGAAFKTRSLLFELRPGLRHVSNADLKFPNCGHNGTTIDIAVSYCW